MATDQYGAGSGNRRDAWPTRPSPAPYRATVSRALSTAWAVLAGNAGRQRYSGTRAVGRHRATARSQAERRGPNRR